MTLDAKRTFDFVKNRKTLFPCACCKKYHEAADIGEETCGVTECGSPLGGAVFPRYEGPLSEDSLQSLCMVCGTHATIRAHFPSAEKTLGFCSDHFEELQPKIRLTFFVL